MHLGEIFLALTKSIFFQHFLLLYATMTNHFMATTQCNPSTHAENWWIRLEQSLLQQTHGDDTLALYDNSISLF